ncbi:MAG: ATP-binding protein [Angelakisella sp.]
MDISKTVREATRPRNQLKLALLIFLLTLIGIILIISIYMELEQAEIKSREDQLQLVALSAARNLENYLGGYRKDLDVITSSPQFNNGFAEFLKTGNTTNLMEYLNSYNVATGTSVGDIMLTDAYGNVLVSTSVNTPYTNLTPTLDATNRMLVFSSQSGKLYLGISAPLSKGYCIMSMVDIEQMYIDTDSSIEIGKKGYVMYKHSSGMIIMHPTKEQIGLDTLIDQKEKYPHFNFSSLEKLIGRQMQGLSGVEIYNSYWWEEESPREVKKICAYVPAHVDKDFLIVSSVADFKEIMDPLQHGLLAMGAVLLILGTAFTVMILLFVHSTFERQGIEKENLYLRDLNSSLEEIHRSEEKLRHFQKLETLGTFTSGIAHELNNLLTPIMAYSILLMDEVPTQDSIRQDVEEIYSASAKVKEVIQQISFISRKDSDTAFTRINVNGGLARALRMVSSIMPITVTLHTQLELPPTCHMIGSDTQLTQVVLNLCNNAFQAMEEHGGTLTVTAHIEKDCSQDGQQTGEMAAVHISDTGCGIPARLFSRIFDPFFTTKKPGEGTGLGLSIVQRIVENHCGTIDVESVVGEGTTFILRLPVSTKPISAATTQNGAQQCILLLENDTEILHMLQTQLSGAGYHTISFTRPGDAIEYLHSENTVDMLITDYTVPQNNDGLEIALLCRNLRGEIPILLMTGFVDREVVEARRNGIIKEYLVKPFCRQELLSIVKKEIAMPQEALLPG